MAISKLGLYNDALRIVGERRLATLTDNRPQRYWLDDVYDLGAVEFCLERVKPRFASKVVLLTTSAPIATGFEYEYALPDDYVCMIGAYSDLDLDDPIERFVIEGGTFASDQETVLLRYVTNTVAEVYTNWTPSFARVVSAYLAREISGQTRPNDFQRFDTGFNAALEASITTDSMEEPAKRAGPTVRTLTQSWFQVYNHALSILGMDELIALDDDSDRRVKLDNALNQGIVQQALEDHPWRFEVSSSQIDLDPSVEPAWGYQYAFELPSDMYRIHGVYCDEYMSTPLKDYRVEDDYLFCEQTTIYIEYIQNELIDNPGAWPQYFRTLVSAMMAERACNVLRGPYEVAVSALERAENRARSNNANASPPRTIARGSWTRARQSRSDYRGRP